MAINVGSVEVDVVPNARGIYAQLQRALVPPARQIGDEVGRIIFPKLARVAELIYRIGYSIADSDGTLVRDDKGARSGRGFQGLLN